MYVFWFSKTYSFFACICFLTTQHHGGSFCAYSHVFATQSAVNTSLIASCLVLSKMYTPTPTPTHRTHAHTHTHTHTGHCSPNCSHIGDSTVLVLLFAFLSSSSPSVTPGSPFFFSVGGGLLTCCNTCEHQPSVMNTMTVRM